MSLARKFFPDIVKLRRTLHKFPELAYSELETADRMYREMRKLSIVARKGIGRTGVVGRLSGSGRSGLVALRADMDALPVNEESGVPFASRNPGKMHACGHDTHMAMLVGAARILSHLRDELKGSVVFLFQPSEEKNPGGAPAMIKDGALEGADVVFGQHITNDVQVGKFAFRSGPMMASADEIYITVFGKGGHGAKPHHAIDPVYISAQVIVALQAVISRMRDPFDPSVLTVGSVHGGTATNIIPDSVALSGTLRTMSESWRRRALTLITKTAKDTAASFGGRCSVEISPGYPVLSNSPDETEFATEAARKLFGAPAVLKAPPVMGAEDFAYFLRKTPGTFWWIGGANGKIGATSSIHSATFRIDESALAYGSAFLAFLTIEYLRRREYNR